MLIPLFNDHIIPYTTKKEKKQTWLIKAHCVPLPLPGNPNTNTTSCSLFAEDSEAIARLMRNGETENEEASFGHPEI
jgi:hypothetical protein